MNENSKLLDDKSKIQHAPVKDASALKEAANTSETQLKLEVAQARITQLEEKLKEYQTKQQELELQNVEYQSMKIKIERIESGQALWEEGKMLTARAAKANELEKELNVAKETIITLKESVRGKLLLEEQMANLTKRYLISNHSYNSCSYAIV